MRYEIIRIVLVLVLALTTVQAQTSQEEYNKLIEKQNTTLLSTDEEVIIIDGVAWQRKYGEKEYVLTPSVPNIQNYQARIRQFDDKVNNKFKSNFHFIKIPVTELNKSILKNANIQIPTYVVGEVNVYLPEIDIDILHASNVKVEYLNEYGLKHRRADLTFQKEQTPTAIIFTEGFETNVIPGSVYSTTLSGSANCGWNDVSCYKHSGSWGAWCAGTGAGCNACGGDYVNNMSSQFWKTAPINTSSYQNLSFTWWMDYDFNDSGTSDILTKYWWLTGSWVVSATSYNSSSPDDELLWKQHTATFAGIQTDFSYEFDFYSNSIATSFGVYIDDIELAGTATNPGIKEQQYKLSNVKICPNPNNGFFQITIDSDIKKGEIILFNSIGQKVYEQKIQEGTNNIEPKNIENGLYSYILFDNKEPLNSGRISIDK